MRDRLVAVGREVARETAQPNPGGDQQASRRTIEQNVGAGFIPARFRKAGAETGTEREGINPSPTRSMTSTRPDLQPERRRSAESRTLIGSGPPRAASTHYNHALAHPEGVSPPAWEAAAVWGDDKP